MGLRVSEMLSLDPLQELSLVAGGEGLDRVVEEVSVLEVPKDFDCWLRGGEFILTTLYNLHGDLRAQVGLVEKLAKADVAALGIHPGITSTAIPHEMIEEADVLRFPLILLPSSMPYATIISAVLGTILNRQALLLKRSEEINRELTRLIIRGGDVSAIAATLAQLIRQPVLLTNDSLEPLATGDFSGRYRSFLENGLHSSDFLESLKMLRSEKLAAQLGAKQELITFKVEVGGRVLKQVVAQASSGREVYGYIFTWETGGVMGELDFLALGHATTALALEMVKRQAVAETERRLRSDFLEEVLEGHFANEEALLRKGRQMGLNLAHKHMVLTIRIKPGPGDEADTALGGQRAIPKRERRVRVALQPVLEQGCPGSLVLPKGDTVLILAHFDLSIGRYPARQKALDLGTAIRDTFVSVFGGAPVSVGIGDFYPSILDLGKSYYEARQAVEKGEKIFGPGHITAYYDLGFYGVLGGSPEGQVAEFATGVLRQLLEYDAENQTELVKTLEAYLDCKESLTASAKQLFVHPNTVKYRIEKIREILGFDPFSHAQKRLNFHVALKARRLL